jgi:hypothetical protein
MRAVSGAFFSSKEGHDRRDIKTVFPLKRAIRSELILITEGLANKDKKLQEKWTDCHNQIYL